MNVASYIFGVASAVLTLAVVIEMLRRRRLRERHAVWWLIAGTLALIVGIFPPVLIWAANLVGVAVPLNLVFFVSVAVLFLVCIQHSAELTALESKTRKLAETAALQDLRIQTLEQALAEKPTAIRPLPSRGSNRGASTSKSGSR
ncbi:MAG: DUF2304 domain-containing protein [Rhodoglobus sp.]